MAAVLLCSVVAKPARAKELSDKSVKVLMKYAWAILPNKFTFADGTVIEIDKSKKEAHMVPLENARAIVKVARLSAHAQICGLANEQTANYRTLMRSETKKKKWTKEQILYVSQLHLFTVMWLTGNVKLVDREGSKEVFIDEGSANAKKQTCTDAQKEQVAQQILAYVCKVKAINIEGCKN